MKPLELSRVVLVVLASVLVGSACSGSSGESALTSAPTEPAEAAGAVDIETAETEAADLDDPDTLDDAGTPDDLAYAESADESAEAAGPDKADEVPVVDPAPEQPDAAPLCTAIVPESPEPGATGMVTYLLQGDWAQYSYGALYVIDAAGQSAFPSGEPAVRNGDSFEFVIDDSMQTDDGTWAITTSINGQFVEPCDYRTVDLPTVTTTGGGSAGY